MKLLAPLAVLAILLTAPSISQAQLVIPGHGTDSTPGKRIESREKQLERRVQQLEDREEREVPASSYEESPAYNYNYNSNYYQPPTNNSWSTTPYMPPVEYKSPTPSGGGYYKGR